MKIVSRLGNTSLLRQMWALLAQIQGMAPVGAFGD